MKKVLIIAEAGVNNNGSLETAKQLIDAAVDAGVDYVKFQTINTDKMVTKFAKRANYQDSNTGNSDSQYEMLKKLELTENNHKDLINYCNSKYINFLSTGFDIDSLIFLKE